MFWNKKKSDEKKELPDLPNYRNSWPSMSDPYRRSPITTAQEESEDIHSLPSFPDSPMSKGFSQSAIKEAVENEEKEDLPQLPEQEELPARPAPKSKVAEMEEWKPTHIARRASEEKPVFVRLDKFQSAKESLEIIREKVSEIDSLLQSIRDVKMKEEQEIISWEKEIETIKARISSVVTEVFESAVE